MKKEEVVKNNRDFDRIIKTGQLKKNNEFVKSEKRTMISNMFPPFTFFFI